MSLRDDVQAAYKPTGGICSIELALREMRASDPKLADEFVELLADPIHVTPHAALSAALKRRGYKIGANALSRHRLGQCRCDRG